MVRASIEDTAVSIAPKQIAAYRNDFVIMLVPALLFG
jgi:hypothetical protein